MALGGGSAAHTYRPADGAGLCGPDRPHQPRSRQLGASDDGPRGPSRGEQDGQRRPHQGLHERHGCSFPEALEVLTVQPGLPPCISTPAAYHPEWSYELSIADKNFKSRLEAQGSLYNDTSWLPGSGLSKSFRETGAELS